MPRFIRESSLTDRFSRIFLGVDSAAFAFYACILHIFHVEKKVGWRPYTQECSLNHFTNIVFAICMHLDEGGGETRARGLTMKLANSRVQVVGPKGCWSEGSLVRKRSLVRKFLRIVGPKC